MSYSLSFKENHLSLHKPVVMGIVNITTDSFFEGSRTSNLDQTLLKVTSMIHDGASIIDLGAQSTRPGAQLLTAEHEIHILIPTVQAIRSQYPDIWISIDTFYASVAKECIEAGANIINDISAGEFDPQMLPLIAKLQVPYVAMHKQGNPQNMQENPTYSNVVNDVMKYFIEKKKHFDEFGINQWVLDLGYGFGKTVEHNYELLNHSKLFEAIGKPILTGISRKSMIHKPLKISANDALNGTTALNMVALENGSHILRVHDVKEAIQCVEIHCLLKNK
jgi:dihydropteroate synthase